MLQRIFGSKKVQEKEPIEGTNQRPAIDLDQAPSFEIDDTHLVNVAPGFVYLKKALSEEQQSWLVQYALTTCGPNEKEPQKSFWMPRRRKGDWSEELQLNLGIAGRGRVYDALDNFERSDKVKHFASSLVKMARSHDDTLPDMTPTHMILLYYATCEGMVWHADDDENDGDNNHPIVSISLGMLCEFA